jgi:hypothetical protein
MAGSCGATLAPGMTCEMTCDASKDFTAVNGTAGVFQCASTGKAFTTQSNLQCQQYASQREPAKSCSHSLQTPNSTKCQKICTRFRLQ